MPAQPFELPVGFNGEVRLFPLPDLVMFPGNVLPLHIFESRYVEMFEDAIQGDQLIAMATLKPGYDYEYFGRPAIAPFTCIGRVAAHKKTEIGTVNLTLVGLRRAEIDHEIEPVRSFRRAVVRVIDDHLSEADKAGRRLGEQLANQVLRALPSAKELVEHYVQGVIALASLTDVVAFHLPLAMETKLQLLAEGASTREIAARILRETTTAGVRYYPVHRLTLERQQITVATSLGDVPVKRFMGVDGEVRIVPEFEACRRIAYEKNLPIRDVYETIQRETGSSRTEPDNRSDNDRQRS